MAGDLNREASELWNSLKPIIDKEIDARTQGVVQRRKAKVTTAPSLVTNTIGVTEPFGTEMFLPFNTNIISASVGDFVWVEYMYGMTNAFVSMFASADEKDWDVAGDLSVGGNAGISGNLGVSGSTSLQNTTVNGVLDVTKRRCEATLSAAGWYRAIVYNSYNANSAQGSSGEIVTIRIVYTSEVSVQHEISLFMTVGKVAFLNETSHGTINLVDQIRYNYNGSTGYIDIHLATTTACYVNVSFDVASRNYAQGRWVAGTLAPVADSPANETPLARYTFHVKAPMSDVSSLITWDTTNYIADSSGMKVYLDGGKLIFTGQVRLKAGISFQGIDLGTLDSSIAAVTNSFFMAAYASDVTARAVAHPITIYMSDSTTIRAANEGPNTNYAVGSPTANNYIRFNSVIPLA